MENFEKIDKLELVEPSPAFEKSYREAVLEFQAEDNGMGFSVQNPEGSFDDFFQKLKDKSEDVNLPEGRVPQSELWLVNGDRVIGWAKIRHYLNEELLKKGGHIGYGIRPSERGKGYGNKILELALKKAKSLGINKVLLTCDDANVPSAKVIESNGGVLENKIDYEGKLRRRYWIEIK